MNGRVPHPIRGKGLFLGLQRTARMGLAPKGLSWFRRTAPMDLAPKCQGAIDLAIRHVGRLRSLRSLRRPTRRNDAVSTVLGARCPRGKHTRGGGQGRNKIPRRSNPPLAPWRTLLIGLNIEPRSIQPKHHQRCKSGRGSIQALYTEYCPFTPGLAASRFVLQYTDGVPSYFSLSRALSPKNTREVQALSLGSHLGQTHQEQTDTLSE